MDQARAFEDLVEEVSDGFMGRYPMLATLLGIDKHDHKRSCRLGKHMIRALREEVSQRLGSGFDLKAFHEAFIYAGSIPMKCQHMIV